MQEIPNGFGKRYNLSIKTLFSRPSFIIISFIYFGFNFVLEKYIIIDSFTSNQYLSLVLTGVIILLNLILRAYFIYIMIKLTKAQIENTGDSLGEILKESFADSLNIIKLNLYQYREYLKYILFIIIVTLIFYYTINTLYGPISKTIINEFVGIFVILFFILIVYITLKILFSSFIYINENISPKESVEKAKTFNIGFKSGIIFNIILFYFGSLIIFGGISLGIIYIGNKIGLTKIDIFNEINNKIEKRYETRQKIKEIDNTLQTMKLNETNITSNNEYNLFNQKVDIIMDEKKHSTIYNIFNTIVQSIMWSLLIIFLYFYYLYIKKQKYSV